MTDAGYNTYMTGKRTSGQPDGSKARAHAGSSARSLHLTALRISAAGIGAVQLFVRYRDGDEIVNVGDDFYTTRFYT